MYHASFIIFLLYPVSNKCTNYIIKVYITTVVLCRLHRQTVVIYTFIIQFMDLLDILKNKRRY